MPGPATPLCRCRVLYIGSAVPLKSKDGLQGIQEPLKQLYPADGSKSSVDTKGVDAWLSVWINGLVLEYTSDADKEQFFPIQALHYCAAVRYVNVASYALEGGGEKFLPLDSPFANLPDTTHPPIFAAILRRTQGVRVLECHAFVCMNEKAANALVRSCFNAYADSMYLDMANPEAAANGHGCIDIAESSLMGAIKHQSKPKGINDIENMSPKSEDKNGYQDVMDVHVSDDETGAKSDPEKEQQRWHEAKAKYNWQQRQQAGDYETASISSSVAGKYKKKEKQQVGKQGTATLGTGAKMPAIGTLPPQKRPPSVAASYSNALVPFGQTPAQYGTVRRRAKSEIDIHTASRNAMVPYVPPHMRYPGPMMFPPQPGPMFFPPPPPPGVMGMMPRPGLPPFMPPQHFSPPLGPMMGWPPMPPPSPMMPHPMYGPPLPPLTMPLSMRKKQKNSKKKKAQVLDSFSPMNAQYGMMPPPHMMMPPRAFEEPPYLPGQMPPPMNLRMPFEDYPPMAPRGGGGMGPPMFNMPPYYPMPHQGGPQISPYDDQEDFHDTYKSKQKTKSSKDKRYQQRDFDRRSMDESTTSSKHSIGADKRSPIPDYWENRNVYDGTLFRRQNLNEKAFGASIKHEGGTLPGRRHYEDERPRLPEPVPDYNGINGHGRGSRAEEDDMEGKFRNMDINYRSQQDQGVYQRNY